MFITLSQPRTQWVRDWPAQCVLTGSQIQWTAEVEDAIRSKGAEGVKDYYCKWSQQLLETVDLVRGNLTSLEVRLFR